VSFRGLRLNRSKGDSLGKSVCNLEGSEYLSTIVPNRALTIIATTLLAETLGRMGIKMNLVRESEGEDKESTLEPSKTKSVQSTRDNELREAIFKDRETWRRRVERLSDKEAIQKAIFVISLVINYGAFIKLLRSRRKCLPSPF
jgi:hypothetical protein